ncbi:hypothetical protein [Streptomyces sp. NBC_00094]|uniref:hypothetical protein n=1 Tax=Streptomyces sp. NBC_00094 TaxID=2903620 RepID=UPI00224CE6C7|nr:hypothetical protein [Streptomyces sp. NBC_00094]MCX5391644.1 hypothetical protein [Streptomyces sp. NBC_00094]
MSLDETGTAPSPTYALLAAEAGREVVAPARAHRPEADVRAVPWWRVRSLRRVSGLNEVLILVAVCAGLGVLSVTGLNEGIEVGTYTVGVLTLGALLVSGYRLLTTGRHAARRLARAATAPAPATRRYVLLRGPAGGRPTLFLFPDGERPDDLPDGLLMLPPTGALPSAPTGSVELHGWLDRAESGLPVVVPWVEGRPLWPAEPLWETGGTDFEGQLEWLAPGEEDQEEAPQPPA